MQFDVTYPGSPDFLRRHGASTRAVALAALAVILLVVAPLGQADILSSFPEATLEQERPIRSPAHRVMLSPIREIRGEIRATSEARVTVEGTGRLFEVNEDVSRQDARRWYRRKLDDLGAQILFDCSGRDCGRSNVWANQIFRQSTLYGRDSDQDYLAAGLVDDDGDSWLVLLYTVTRGNEREYLWVEQLELTTESAVPGFTLASGRIQGPVVVPWTGDVSIRFDWGAEVRRQVHTMAELPGSQVVIAGFAGLAPSETVEEAVARSEEAAKTLSALLDRSGISRSRHIIQAIGPTVLSPGVGRPANRVEILVIAPPAYGDGQGDPGDE